MLWPILIIRLIFLSHKETKKNKNWTKAKIYCTRKSKFSCSLFAVVNQVFFVRLIFIKKIVLRNAPILFSWIQTIIPRLDAI